MIAKFEGICYIMSREYPTKALPGNLQLTCDLKSIILFIQLGLFCSLLIIISVHDKIIIHQGLLPHSSPSLHFLLPMYCFLSFFPSFFFFFWMCYVL